MQVLQGQEVGQIWVTWGQVSYLEKSGNNSENMLFILLLTMESNTDREEKAISDVSQISGQ